MLKCPECGVLVPLKLIREKLLLLNDSASKLLCKINSIKAEDNSEVNIFEKRYLWGIKDNEDSSV